MITRNLALWVCGGSVTPGLPLPADSPAPEPSRDVGSGSWKSLLRLPGAGLRGWPASRIWQQAETGAHSLPRLWKLGVLRVREGHVCAVAGVVI